MYKIDVSQKGKNTIINTITDTRTGDVITPLFLGYTCPSDYINANVRPIEPMTAKEPLNHAELEVMLTSDEYIAEEKLDGTRCTMHLGSKNRLFSRRISKKTNWYAENSDSVPHLRDLKTPLHLHDTILDGEMRIDGREFKDVSSTLNCKWDEAILRQSHLGYITFHAFDIIYYKGVYIAKMPLMKRKELLRKVVEELNDPYVLEEIYTDNTIVIDNKTLTKKEWYEHIVQNGGEGMMLKSKYGTYKHTRGREYTKYKKYDTWDVVILDFVEPTREYTGKEIDTWEYWEGNTPVTKHYAMKWIGTVRYGVIITQQELEKLQKANPKEKFVTEVIQNKLYLEVGECSGMNEDTRMYMTRNRDTLIGQVIEVGANELIKKTGKLRHPRFIRFRTDKENDRCIWQDHIRGR